MEPVYPMKVKTGMQQESAKNWNRLSRWWTRDIRKYTKVSMNENSVSFPGQINLKEGSDTEFFTVQSQADLFVNLSGGYAIPEKHTVFSRLSRYSNRTYILYGGSSKMNS